MAGIFSYNSKEMPLTYNWNKVYVPYCDGASFAGEVEDPTSVEINGKKHQVICILRFCLIFFNFDFLIFLGFFSGEIHFR